MSYQIFDTEPQADDVVTFKGHVAHIIWQNPDGYMIFVMRPDEKYQKGCLKYVDEITVKGAALGITLDTNVEISGLWVKDPKYGWQIKMHDFEVLRPQTGIGIINYLSSGLINGIGEKLAAKIYEIFGNRTYDILDNEPERLSEVPGIGKKKIERITKSWNEQHEGRAVIKFLAGYDISSTKAINIYKVYGSQAVEKIKQNPYCLEEHVRGIGFVEADKIALKMGIALDSAIRLQSSITHICRIQTKKKGHTCIIKDSLISATVRELGDIHKQMVKDGLTKEAFKITREMVNDQINNMVNIKKLIPDNLTDNKGIMRSVVYTPECYEAEMSIARNLERIQHTSSPISEKRWEQITKALSELSIEYDPTQLEAIKKAVNSRIFILTGGPGTGKTTTTRGIILALTMLGKDIKLAAPTGRAAKRMSEATNMEALTIHRLLEWNAEGKFTRNETQPLDGDVLIVDESSMIDIFLMSSLLKAVPAHMSVIFIGDIDQLPSVQAGTVLKDLIDSNCFEVVRLNKIFRQAESSLIITNAHAINKGIMPQIPAYGTPGADCVGVGIADYDPSADELAVKYIVQAVRDYLPKDCNVSSKDIQVLIPMHDGKAGVDAVNIMLQEVLNPDGQKIRKGKSATGYRVGDKVMQTINDYKKQVFNGTVGYIESYDPEEQLVYIDFDGIITEYELSDLSEITLAYAITIHKSQGSEYPVVVMPVLQTYSFQLQRNLIYTGLTRAKQKILLIGQNAALQLAVRKSGSAVRYGMLQTRIRALVQTNKQEIEKEKDMKYVVEYTDPSTGATSPIDNIEAPDGYTASDYINACQENADSDWNEMLEKGSISLVGAM